MVHSFCSRLLSLLRANSDHCSCRIRGQDSDSEAQMVVDGESSCEPCDSRILVTNNNYRVLCVDEKSENPPSRWSSPDNWTRASPECLERVSRKTSGTCCARVVLTSVGILVTLLILAFVLLYFRPISVVWTIADSTTNVPSTSTLSPSARRTLEPSARYHEREYKKRVSILTFKQLKSSPSLDANGIEQREDGLVLPASMLFTSANNSQQSGAKDKSCCQMEKYSQVISSSGCKSVTIVNRKCSGVCKAVWIPGIFESFPVCSSSRMKWRSVSLVCGQNRRKRLRVESIKRCSCMESQSKTPE